MSDIFESKWGETKQALTEGLAGNKKKNYGCRVREHEEILG